MNPETLPSSSELSGEPISAPIVVKQEPIPTSEVNVENIQVEAERQEKEREEARVAREQIANLHNVTIVSPNVEVPVAEVVSKPEAERQAREREEEVIIAREQAIEAYSNGKNVEIVSPNLEAPVAEVVPETPEQIMESYKNGKNVEIVSPGLEAPVVEAGAQRTAENKEEEPIMAEVVSEPATKYAPQEIAEDRIHLNSLQKQIDKLRLEVEQLKKENEFSQLEGLGKELNDLLSKREELNEKVSGKSIGETMADAEKKVAKMFGYEKREDYVRALTETTRININAEKEKNLINKAFAELPEKERQKKYGNSPELLRVEMEKKREKMGLKSEEFYGLLSAGYKPQETKKKGFFHPIPSFRNFFRSERKVTIPPNGKKVWMRTDRFEALAKDAGEKYTTNITNEAQKRLGEQWGKAVEIQAEESMKERAYDKDGAIERVGAGYKEIRTEKIKKLIEYLDSINKPKTLRESKPFDAEPIEEEALEKLFAYAEKNKLNGDPKNDSKLISNLLEGFGVTVKPLKIAGKIGSGMLKGVGGLLKLLISLVATATLGSIAGLEKVTKYSENMASEISKKRSISKSKRFK